MSIFLNRWHKSLKTKQGSLHGTFEEGGSKSRIDNEKNNGSSIGRVVYTTTKYKTISLID